MKKNEQDILNIVKDEMTNVKVPESLMPEQIEKKLKGKKSDRVSDNKEHPYP